MRRLVSCAVLAVLCGVGSAQALDKVRVGKSGVALAWTMIEAGESAGIWKDPSISLAESVLGEFANLVAAAAKPLDDVRGTASYRRHACHVLARRALTWALEERRLPTWL